MCPVVPVDLGNVVKVHDSHQKRSAVVRCRASWTGDEAHSFCHFISVPASFVVRQQHQRNQQHAMKKTPVEGPYDLHD